MRVIWIAYDLDVSDGIPVSIIDRDARHIDDPVVVQIFGADYPNTPPTTVIGRVSEIDRDNAPPMWYKVMI